MTTFFSFFKQHLKIILLIGLPLYGFLINLVVVDQFSLLTNPGVMGFILPMLNMPFFYNKQMFQYEWFIHPVLNIISNLIFWIPVAILINRYVEKRKGNKNQVDDN